MVDLPAQLTSLLWPSQGPDFLPGLSPTPFPAKASVPAPYRSFPVPLSCHVQAAPYTSPRGVYYLLSHLSQASEPFTLEAAN